MRPGRCGGAHGRGTWRSGVVELGESADERGSEDGCRFAASAAESWRRTHDLVGRVAAGGGAGTVECSAWTAAVVVDRTGDPAGRVAGAELQPQEWAAAGAGDGAEKLAG